MTTLQVLLTHTAKVAKTAAATDAAPESQACRPTLSPSWEISCWRWLNSRENCSRVKPVTQATLPVMTIKRH